jgi:signal transduction histidine kinase
MEISDNGQGFELDGHQTSKKQGRLGLTGMRERAEMIGANFSVASAPGAPTTIRVTVPPRNPETIRQKIQKTAPLKTITLFLVEDRAIEKGIFESSLQVTIL